MIRLLSVLLLFGCVFRSLAQSPLTQELWLQDSNVPIAVNDLYYEANGYLWLATDKGVYRFNGTTFQQLPTSNPLAATSIGQYEGTILAGYENGRIAACLQDSFQSVSEAPPASSTITSLSGHGPFLLLTSEEDGLQIRFPGGSFLLDHSAGLLDEFIYNAVATDEYLLFASDRGMGVFQLRGEQPSLSYVGLAEGLPDNLIRVVRKLPETDWCWLGAHEGGVALYHLSDRRTILPETEWTWGQVNDVMPLNSHEAVAVTEDGFFLELSFQKGKICVTPTELTDVRPRKLARDASGTIWCATDKGLLRITASYARAIKLPDFRLTRTTALAASGETIFYTQNNRIFTWKPGSLPAKLLEVPDTVTCMFPDADGRLWIGTFNSGLFCFDGGRLNRIRQIGPIGEGLILSVSGVRDRIWVASLHGVEELLVLPGKDLNVQHFRHHNKRAGIGSDYVYQIYPDNRDNVWLATDGGGISMYDGKTFHRWDSTSGFNSQVVYSIAGDASRHIWAGTLEQSLLRYDGTSWKPFGQEQGLLESEVTALAAAGKNGLVVVNRSGIDILHLDRLQVRHLHKRYGTELNSTSPVLNNIASDAAGNVYVPFEDGLILVPAGAADHAIQPQVTISALALFFHPVGLSRNQFTHDENHISLRFETFNFVNPGKQYYRYKLQGYEERWIYTSDAEIPFAQLPPGDYTFRVQVALNPNFLHAGEDSYSFTITRPYWQSPWFILLALTGLILLSVFLVRVRERSIRKVSRLQKERMQFEYEHLKSQVNPHFLFNSLNTLVNLIEEDKEAAIDYTVRLSDLYRHMLLFKDQDLIPLKEEFKVIDTYMYIQQSRFGEALQLKTHIPAEVMHSRKIVPLALQLLVENAIKHNVVSRSQPLVITIEADHQQLTIRNPIRPKQSKEAGAGLGIQNIRKRYSLLTDREALISEANNEYLVTLPLL